MASNDMNNVPMYPFMFDPSQFTNKFAPIPDTSPIPMTSYVGAPVNAGTGIPISSYQAPAAPASSPPAAAGTNLNSVPDNSALMNYIASQNAILQGSPSSLNQGGFGAGNNVSNNSAAAQIQNNAQQLDILRRQAAAAQPAAQPAGAQQTASGPANNASAYLSALANPDPVITQGAQPSVGGYQPSSSGIDAIMNQIASMQPPQPAAPTPGIGGGSSIPTQFAGGNNGFLNALAALRGVA